MTRSLLFLLLLVMACSSPAAETTTTITAEATTTAAFGSTTTQPPVECPPAPYELTFLPTGVGGQAVLDPAEVEPDVWTSVPGTSATLLARSDETIAVAVIRGTLPAVEWPAERGEVFVDGTRGVVGPHPDGTWVAGWFEAPGERCDQYTMVLYPPVSPGEAEQVIAGMNRVGG